MWLTLGRESPPRHVAAAGELCGPRGAEGSAQRVHGARRAHARLRLAVANLGRLLVRGGGDGEEDAGHLAPGVLDRVRHASVVVARVAGGEIDHVLAADESHLALFAEQAGFTMMRVTLLAGPHSGAQLDHDQL